MGENHGYLYFPSFAGVGRSLNYYPTGDEQAEDGVAQVAVGLGKYIVDGGASLRFSPRHPDKVLQTSTIELALRDTQRYFYALGNDISSGFDVDDSFNLVRRNISDYAGDSALDLMVSTYDADNDMLIDNNLGLGRRVVTFANILRDKAFPLAPAVDFMLTQGQQAMGRPVEIEFAGVINDSNARRAGADKGHIYWLQIRPIIDRKDMVEDTVLNASDDRVILRSNTALGHGAIDAIDTVVYVRPSAFDSAATRDIAAEIAHINAEFIRQDRNYILIGPGRWGTSDPALGIPVKWPEISAARLIAEASLGDYRIEPSQGTHFFQNLTSFGVGYFTVNPYSGDGIYDTDYLDAQPAEYESAHVRVVRLSAPMPIGIDGRRGIGVVLKPTDTQDNTTIPNI